MVPVVDHTMTTLVVILDSVISPPVMSCAVVRSCAVVGPVVCSVMVRRMVVGVDGVVLVAVMASAEIETVRHLTAGLRGHDRGWKCEAIQCQDYRVQTPSLEVLRHPHTMGRICKHLVEETPIS